MSRRTIASGQLEYGSKAQRGRQKRHTALPMDLQKLNETPEKSSEITEPTSGSSSDSTPVRRKPNKSVPLAEEDEEPLSVPSETFIVTPKRDMPGSGDKSKKLLDSFG